MDDYGVDFTVDPEAPIFSQFDARLAELGEEIARYGSMIAIVREQRI
jgi:hypothetical protein